MKSTLIALAAILLVRPVPVMGQTPPELVPCGVPLAPLPPCGESPRSARTVAVVDGALLTLDDLDANLRQRVEHLGDLLTEVRRSALSAEIDMVLLECGAARRKMAPRDFYDLEVSRRVASPTDAEVAAEYEAHRDRYGARPLQDSRLWIAGRISAEREATRVSEVAKGLRSRFPVAVKEPIGPNAPPGAVLATVGPRSITRVSSSARLDAATDAVARALWEDESKAVRLLVRDRLVKAEAARRATTPEAVLKIEIEDRMTPATESEVVAFHEKYRSFYGDDLAAARPKILESLAKDRRAVLEKELDRKISAGRAVRIALEEPERPVLAIETAGSPSRGNPKAAVTLVEFGDFQCPPCGKAWALFEEALKPYGERVRYVFRQTPLPIHEFAAKAAEAALAAHEQKRFWEYANILFHNQNALDVASLKRHASAAGLNVERFARDLDSGRLATTVQEEKRAAARCGVAGTPKFFVNGVVLLPSDYSVEGIRGILDREFAKVGPAPASSAGLAR